MQEMCQYKIVRIVRFWETQPWLRCLLNRNLLLLLRWDQTCGGGRGAGGGQVWCVHRDGDGAVGLVGGDREGGAAGALAVGLGDVAVLADRTGALIVVSLTQAFGELKPIL